MIAKLLGLFTNFAGGWQKWAAIGAAFSAVIIYVGWLKWDISTYETKLAVQHEMIGTLNGQLDDAVTINKSNAATLARIQADAKRAQAAVVSANEKAADAAEKLRVIGREIERVPADQNTKLGAAVRDVVKRLWVDPAAADVHPVPGGKAGSSGKPTGVSPTTR